MSEAKNSRQARQLVRRMARDCNLTWPGGEENAAIVANRVEGRWRLETIDGRPAPYVSGPSPIARLLRDGFLVLIWGEERIHLHHIAETPAEILTSRPTLRKQHYSEDRGRWEHC